MNDHSKPIEPAQRAEMTIERLRQIVEIYGAAPRRWPEEERAAARALILRSNEAEAVMRAAEPLDQMLAGLSAPAPSEAVSARVHGLVPPAVASDGMSDRMRAVVRYVFAPLAIGGAGAALVALSLWMVFAGPGTPDAVPVAPAIEVTADEAGQGLMQGLAVVDVASGDQSGEITDADLGLDTAVLPTGDGPLQLSAGEITGIALD